ncbi:MAG: DNA primase, partial [Bacteroidetes bacterium]|nr:DNA primase [Bacteroidota bacterium]
YCFGCHAKGDIFTFVQEFEGLDFIGSLKMLADRAGIKIEKFESGQKGEKDRILSVVEQAVIFYQRQFDNYEPAKKYMKDRGVSEETISSFRIGYAPLGWRNLFDHLSSKNVSPEDMLKAGLIKKKEDSQNSYYDVFRGRVMFPIHNLTGKVIAFGGRILKTDKKFAKYLNSPESEIYHKSKVLYGIYQARKAIMQVDKCYLVEGYTDVISMHQAGIENVVASSGTSLTEDQIRLIRRFTFNVTILYDGDAAGIKASLRGIDMVLEEV